MPRVSPRRHVPLVAAALQAILVAVGPLHAQERGQVLATHEMPRSVADADLMTRPARLQVERTPLPDALLRLGYSSGVFIAFSSSVLPNASVSCDCANLTVGAALDRMLAPLSLAYRELGGQIVVEAPAARPVPPATATSAPRPEPVRASRRLEALVTGRVTDAASGQPLTGAQISVAGTMLGGITDSDGRYRIARVPAGQHEVRAQLIGYSTGTKSVTVPAEGTVVADFTLAQTAIALDAVLITGTAGRQERRAQGATIADVKVAQIIDVAPVKTVSEVLQGRIPGISITQGSGVSGSAQQIRIRGASSISLSNEPLVYIDGVRVDTRATSVASGAMVSALNDINPDEIESIEVVKGPAAATLYGADASAGVIQIVTKRGTAGSGFRQTASFTASVLDPTFTPYRNFGVCRQLDIDNGAPICQGLAAGSVVSDNTMERYGLPNEGSEYSFSWTAQGGGDQYGFFSSLKVDSEDGLFPNNEYQRISARLNYNVLPSENVRIEANFPVIRVTGDFPVTAGSSRGWTTGGMAGTPLTVGTPTDGWYASNRTPDAISKIENTLNSVRVTPDLKLNYQAGPVKNRLTVGADIGISETSAFFPKNDQGWYSAQENRGQIQEDRRSLTRFTANYLGTMNVELPGEWSSMLSFGSELQVEEEDHTWALGNSLTTNAARSVSAAAQRSGGQEVVRDRRVGFYGQWEPNYREKLYLQFGVRADRFAAFGTDAPWFISPSARASWVVSDESFWNVDAIESLRLRAAYGTTGRAPQAGVALRTYSAAPYMTGPGTVGSGVVPLNPGNAGLEPERGEELEVGFDAAFLNQRLGLEVTYFNKTTRNLLLRVPQPPSLAFQENPFRNVGEVLNRGFEIGANAQILSGERVRWDVRVGLATLRNEILDLGGVEPFSTIRFGQVNRVTEGQQVGAFYTHRIRRFDEATGVAIVSDTLEYVGNLLPTLEGNLSSTLSLPGGLRLYAQLDMKRDFMLYNATAMYRERNFGVAENWIRRNEVLTTEERASRFGPFVTESGAPIDAGSVLDAYLEPADFVRLNEVSLIYTVPRSAARFVPGAKTAQLTLSARNVAIWTDYTGFNPDVQNEFDAIAGRADFFTLPPARRVSMRLDLTF